MVNPHKEKNKKKRTPIDKLNDRKSEKEISIQTNLVPMKKKQKQKKKKEKIRYG